MVKKHNINELEKIISNGTDDINSYFKLGALYFDNGKYEKVLSLYENLNEMHLTKIEKARILREKGQALQLLNKAKDAIVLFHKSFQLIQDEKDSIDSLDLKGLNLYSIFILSADLKERRKYANKALEYFKKLIKKFNVSEEEYLTNSYIADIYMNLDEYDKALKYYNMIIKVAAKNHNVAWALAGAASVYGLKGDQNKSVEYFNRAIKKAGIKVPTTKIFFDMGKMYFLRNQFEEASKAFRNALNYIKNDILLYKNEEFEIDINWHLGTIAYNLRNEEDTLHFFNNILKRIDNTHYYYPNINITLGHFYMEKNDFKKANAHYNSALMSPSASTEEKKMAKDCLEGIGVAPLI